jgi:hypothetical protein
MKTPVNSPDRRGVVTALWSVAIVGVLLTLAAPLLFGAGTAPSVAIGTALAVGNLWALARLVQSFLSPASARLPWLVLSLFKFFALFVVVAVLVRAGYAKVLPLMFGYAALPLGIVASQLRAAPPAESES